jgi:hypothetical protein
MLPLPGGREASAGSGAARYACHRQEQILLYHLVQEYYPALKAHLAAQGRALPGYVEQGSEDDLKCGRRLPVGSADLTHRACPTRLLCCCAGYGWVSATLTPGASRQRRWRRRAF